MRRIKRKTYMKFTSIKMTITGLILAVSSMANAGIIDSRSVLLDDAGATQLEIWYGQGDLDWNSLWYGSTGATATSWHNAVDGVTNTFSIYNVTFNESVYLIGGYNAAAWNSTDTYSHAVDSFIFNLTTGVMHNTDGGWLGAGRYTTRNKPDFFALFGASYDLIGGRFELGKEYGSSTPYGAYNGKFPNLKGNIIDGTYTTRYFAVNSLETFSVSRAASVPEPSTLAIFSLGIMGLALRRFKKQS